MRVLAALVAVAVAVLAGCGTSTGHSSAGQQAAATHPKVTHQASPPASSVAATNERRFAYGLASATSFAPLSTVAGQVMTAYIREQVMLAAADAAAGNPAAAEKVIKIAGGYKLCWNYGPGNSGCSAFTDWKINAAGRITGVSVDGQPIAGRLGKGAGDASSGLVLSDVTAYRPAGQSYVEVAFKLRDVSSTALETGSPSALGVLDTSAGHFQEDDQKSPVLPTLRPGETITAYEVFDTPGIAGTFSLRTNNQLQSVLVSSTIVRVR